MKIKNRKINKEELELWKLATRNDKIIGNYKTTTEENKIQNYSQPISRVIKDNPKVEVNISDFPIQNNQINKRTKTKLQRGMIRPEIRIDLHGKTLKEAKKSLSDFIKHSVDNNIRCILVITGKKKTINGSKGIIRENLPLWLKEHDLFNYILFHCYATKKDGDDGARYILLRKKDKVLYG